MSNKSKTRQNILFVMLKLSATGWLQILDALLFPLTFALGGALLYSELDKVFAETTSASGVLVAIGDDIMSDPILAIAFVVVFFLWLLTKLRRNPIDKKLDEINDTLNNNFKMLNDKIDILVQRGEHNGRKQDSSHTKA